MYSLYSSTNKQIWSLGWTSLYKGSVRISPNRIWISNEQFWDVPGIPYISWKYDIDIIMYSILESRVYLFRGCQMLQQTIHWNQSNRFPQLPWHSRTCSYLSQSHFLSFSLVSWFRCGWTPMLFRGTLRVVDVARKHSFGSITTTSLRPHHRLWLVRMDELFRLVNYCSLSRFMEVWRNRASNPLITCQWNSRIHSLTMNSVQASSCWS